MPIKVEELTSITVSLQVQRCSSLQVFMCYGFKWLKILFHQEKGYLWRCKTWLVRDICDCETCLSVCAGAFVHMWVNLRCYSWVCLPCDSQQGFSLAWSSPASSGLLASEPRLPPDSASPGLGLEAHRTYPTSGPKDWAQFLVPFIPEPSLQPNFCRMISCCL